MRILLALAVILMASPALAFEGVVDAKSLGGSADASIELRIQVSKQGDVRVDTSTKSGAKDSSQAAYIKPSKGKYDYAIDHDRKQATKIPKDMIAKMAKRAASEGTEKNPNVQVENLGTETVSGHKTRHVQLVDKDEGTTTDLWLSDRYSAELWKNVFSFGGDRGKNTSNQWTQVMQKKYGVKPGFVMKMLSKDKSGAKSGLQVTWIEEKKVDAKVFSVPPGYKVVEMPDVAGMAGAMPSKMPTSQEEAEQMQKELMQKLQEMQKQQR